jgi:beta-galactosidase
MKGFILSAGLIVAMLFCGVDASAQQRKNDEKYRTLLIPYPTETLAKEMSMSRQRYMQPIDEWVEVDGVLRGEFTFPFSWLERQVFLRIEAAEQPFEVYVNGKLAGSSTNGFAAAEYNITKLSREDSNNIELRLLGNDSVSKIECFEPSGATPRVYIISQPRVRVRDISWSAELGGMGIVNSNFEVVMRNETMGDKTSTLYYELYLNDTIRLDGGKCEVWLGMYQTDTMRFGVAVPDSMLWSRGSANQVRLMLKNRIAGRDVEFYEFPVALRELKFENNKFYINNAEESIKWCELSPNATLDKLREEMQKSNYAIRFTAGCVSEELLNFCDDNGIYVAITAPINSSSSGTSRKRGGNPSNNPTWRKEYVDRTMQMYYTTRRHPSVIAYFLADDSSNGIALYESYLALKRVAGDRPVIYLDGGREWNSDYHK